MTALLTAVGSTPTALAMFLRPTAVANFSEVILLSMPQPYPQLVDVASPTIGGLPNFAISGFQSGMSKDAEFIEIGQRVEAIRVGFSDLSQRAWAERHGFSPTQYNNWEKGVRRIPLEASEKLCKLYGLTLDFIYLGRRDGLSETATKSV